MFHCIRNRRYRRHCCNWRGLWSRARSGGPAARRHQEPRGRQAQTCVTACRKLRVPATVGKPRVRRTCGFSRPKRPSRRHQTPPRLGRQRRRVGRLFPPAHQDRRSLDRQLPQQAVQAFQPGRIALPHHLHAPARERLQLGLPVEVAIRHFQLQDGAVRRVHHHSHRALPTADRVRVSSGIATRTRPTGPRACICTASSCRSRHTVTWSTCTPSGARAASPRWLSPRQYSRTRWARSQRVRALAAIPPDDHGAVAAQVGHRARDRAAPGTAAVGAAVRREMCGCDSPYPIAWPPLRALGPATHANCNSAPLVKPILRCYPHG